MANENEVESETVEPTEAIEAKAEKPKKKKVVRKRRKKKTPEEEWGDLKNEVDTESPLEYNMTSSYEPNTAISHPKFGVGVVTEIMALKISVTFQEGPKFLVHNRK